MDISDLELIAQKMMAIGQIDDHLRGLIKSSRDTLTELYSANIEAAKRQEQYDQAIQSILKEKTEGFPWLADAIAQFNETLDRKVALYLQNKKHPARSSADTVREIAKEKRVLEKQYRVTRNLIKYYESLFPWLPDFVGEDLDELIMQVSQKKVQEEEGDDPVKFYLTPAEYKNLSSAERNQKALDRYWKKKKANWEIGRDYERFIGYLYEEKGYSVSYQGIEEGLEDLGRDLVACKGVETQIIQCKYWAQHKTIHEKHICQLFGTTLKYLIENNMLHRKANKQVQPELFPSILKEQKVNGILITSTSVSTVAKEFASALGIDIKEKVPFKHYPSIKCNISRGTGEKIYHLPMDQQYDKVIIEQHRNERYVETVAEAESLGFRRAWRWKGIGEKK